MHDILPHFWPNELFYLARDRLSMQALRASLVCEVQTIGVLPPLFWYSTGGRATVLEDWQRWKRNVCRNSVLLGIVWVGWLWPVVRSYVLPLRLPTVAMFHLH